MPKFSFLLPTRKRPDLVARFFQSILETTSHIEDIEVILAVDEDDPDSQAIEHEHLTLKKVVLPKGTTMGVLNRACFDDSSGRYVMLINDDVILRTPGWDQTVYSAFAFYKDDVGLVHTNDLLFREKLCTFPILSRRACLEIGVCPSEYRRYRIDDHIYDTYCLLAHLGHKRITYLPDVIFEHENHLSEAGKQDNHIFESSSNKVYVPDQGIIALDVHDFDEKLEERKTNALKLARMINPVAFEKSQTEYVTSLQTIYNSMSQRKPEYVTTVKTSGVEVSSHNMPRVTVGIVSADIRNKHAQKCLSHVKKYTENFDLIILDNNYGDNFNHAKEMNKVLEMAATDFVVLMDDDVFVEEGWLKGLIKCMDAETGVSMPLHKDNTGELSYSGVYMLGDEYGTHAHHLDIPDKPRICQTLCSAILLIDMKKCGNIRFNEAFKKYFHDIDYGLQIWESGYKVVCTPEVAVTHIGGGTVLRGTEQTTELWNADMRVFVAKWTQTGRLDQLQTTTWITQPFLRLLTEIPEKINTFFKDSMNQECPDFKKELGKLLQLVQPFGLFQSLLKRELENMLRDCHSRNDKQKAEFCKNMLSHLQKVPIVPLGYTPNFIDSVNGYNLVRMDRIYAVPLSYGAMDMTLEYNRSLPGIIVAESLEEAYAHLGKAPQGHSVPVSSLAVDQDGSIHPVVVQEGYRGFNIVFCGSRYFALPQQDGPFDVNLINTNIHKTWFMGASIQEVRLAIPTQRMSSLKYLIDKLLSIFIDVGSINMHAHRRWLLGASILEFYNVLFKYPVSMRLFKEIFLEVRRRTRSKLENFLSKKYLSDILKSFGESTSEESVADTQTEEISTLVVDSYKGFTITSFATKYFGVSQAEGAFDIQMMRSGKYIRLFIGNTIKEVKEEIDHATSNSFQNKQKALFLCCIKDELNTNRLLENLYQYELTLLTSKEQRSKYPDYQIIPCLDITGRKINIFNVQALSPNLLSKLKEENFDLVIIPYERGMNWGDTKLETFASTIANRLLAIFPDGKMRLYKGEDIHRILYNKAYLNSMFRFVPHLKGKNILDIGCSDGLVCDLLLSEQPEHIEGLDVLETVGCGYPDKRITYHKMDATCMEFKDNSFDLCLSIATLEHVRAPLKALYEMKRVTRPGGGLYVQAGPLYYSPYGHHMFGYFDDYPWIHLRLTKDEIVDYCIRTGIDEKIQCNMGMDVKDYIFGMLNKAHVNMKSFEEYGLSEFMNSKDVKVLHFAQSYEGGNLFNDDILNELHHLGRETLISHGFELVARVR